MVLYEGLMMIQCESKHAAVWKWYAFWNRAVYEWCILFSFSTNSMLKRVAQNKFVTTSQCYSL